MRISFVAWPTCCHILKSLWTFWNPSAAVRLAKDFPVSSKDSSTPVHGREVWIDSFKEEALPCCSIFPDSRSYMYVSILVVVGSTALYFCECSPLLPMPSHCKSCHDLICENRRLGPPWWKPVVLCRVCSQEVALILSKQTFTQKCKCDLIPATSKVVQVYGSEATTLSSSCSPQSDVRTRGVIGPAINTVYSIFLSLLLASYF